MSEDFSGMARKLSGELDALVQSGDIAAVRKRIANLPEPDGPVDWAPLATFLNAKRVFANKLAELEAKVAAQPAQPAPLDDLLAKAEKHVLEGAAERARSVFADAARRPERQAQKDALLRHAEAFDWMTEVRAAWEDGAKKLADGRAFEFAYVKGGKPNLVGPAGTMKFAGVKDGRVHLIERGVTLTPAFDDLTHATRKNLLALYFEDHKDRRADLAAKNACLDLISFRAYADDRGPSLLLLQQDLESLRADGAPAEVLEVAGAWAEWRGRQLPEARFALDLGDGVTMEFLFVPAGVFTMGSPEGNLLPDGHPDADRLARERPAHKVTLSRPFYMGTYEVTQAQWQKIMGAKTFKFSNPDAPADSVSWKEARDFCDKLGRVHKLDARLPTEAQWEYACKAGAPTWFAPFDGGDAQTWRNLNEMALTPLAWFQGNQNGETQPVGQRKPNAWGFHDMYGNVVEWCEDRYGNYEAKDQLDPTGPAAGQFLVARGGHSKFGFERCRAEYRIQLSTSANSGGLGLRVVLPIGNLGEPVKK
ncbi:MAG: formylglycine-generating enzyme family protein [Planctomycetota bacterium]|nr:formylglycine-generating enzyme family protein [Planctomycetota bacterium]